jgi:cytochrome c553
MSELAAGDPQAAIMTRLMRAYDEAEIDALARYFSQVQP